MSSTGSVRSFVCNALNDKRHTHCLLYFLSRFMIICISVFLLIARNCEPNIMKCDKSISFGVDTILICFGENQSRHRYIVHIFPRFLLVLFDNQTRNRMIFKNTSFCLISFFLCAIDRAISFVKTTCFAAFALDKTSN